MVANPGGQQNLSWLLVGKPGQTGHLARCNLPWVGLVRSAAERASSLEARGRPNRTNPSKGTTLATGHTPCGGSRSYRAGSRKQNSAFPVGLDSSRAGILVSYRPVPVWPPAHPQHHKRKRSFSPTRSSHTVRTIGLRVMIKCPSVRPQKPLLAPHNEKSSPPSPIQMRRQTGVWSAPPDVRALAR